MTIRSIALLFILIFSLQTLNAPSLSAMVRTGVEIDDDGYYYYDDRYDDGYWNGPGFYFGIWHDNEADYGYWRRRHPYYYRGGYYYRHRHGHGGHSQGGGGRHHGGHH